ncbi:hypothetical protein V6N11_069523 [Hibiscus sabdariffa]|uniref:Uncharacterized protein n=1 Tax=Hibiscus sabdariffa TaxID=183260 RepID=A0ABR2Q3G3_9ROSI
MCSSHFTFPSLQETKSDIEVFSGRQKASIVSRAQIEIRFDSLEDLDHRLSLDLRSTSMRRMKIEGEKAEVKTKSIAENMFNSLFEVVDLIVLKESRTRVLSGIVDALKDDNLNTQEMGGVGKMTIVKNLSKQIMYNRRRQYHISFIVVSTHVYSVIEWSYSLLEVHSAAIEDLLRHIVDTWEGI